MAPTRTCRGRSMMLEATSPSLMSAVAFFLIVVGVCGRVAQLQKGQVVIGSSEGSLRGRAVRCGSQVFALTLFLSPGKCSSNALSSKGSNYDGRTFREWRAKTTGGNSRDVGKARNGKASPFPPAQLYKSPGLAGNLLGARAT